MSSHLNQIALWVKCLAGILAAVVLTLGLGALVAFQLDDTFSEPRSPSGKRGVVIMETVVPEVLEVVDECSPTCSATAPMPAVARHAGSPDADSDS